MDYRDGRDHLLYRANNPHVLLISILISKIEKDPFLFENSSQPHSIRA